LGSDLDEHVRPQTNDEAAWNPLIGEHIGPAEAPYYVYLLIDPRSDEVFYVGKGTGDRFAHHGANELLLAADATAEEVGRKLARIREIRASGFEPRTEFARIRIKTEKESYLVEGALIDLLHRFGSGSLTNAVRGHEADAGLVTLDDLRRRFAAPELTTRLKAILITLGWWVPENDTELPRKGHGYRPGLGHQELYDSTRAWWVMGERRKRYAYAVAVFRGITRDVWEIDQKTWRSWSSEVDGPTRIRWSFEGRAVGEDIREAFIGRVGKRIPSTRPGGGSVFGSGNPIAYWPA
jgi:hypothetical protein